MFFDRGAGYKKIFLAREKKYHSMSEEAAAKKALLRDDLSGGWRRGKVRGECRCEARKNRGWAWSHGTFHSKLQRGSSLEREARYHMAIHGRMPLVRKVIHGRKHPGYVGLFSGGGGAKRMVMTGKVAVIEPAKLRRLVKTSRYLTP